MSSSLSQSQPRLQASARVPLPSACTTGLIALDVALKTDAHYSFDRVFGPSSAG